MVVIKNLTEQEINKLRKKVICTESINRYYYDNWDDFISRLTSDEILDGNEKWLPVPYYTNQNMDVEASNKGRIKVNGEIVKSYYEEKLGDLDKKWLENDETKQNVGYLMVQGLDKHVYEMVANAWLGYELGTGFIIHHITNDGYDNRPENLMIVSATDHSKIHPYCHKEDNYKPL